MLQQPQRYRSIDNRAKILKNIKAFIKARNEYRPNSKALNNYPPHIVKYDRQLSRCLHLILA